MTRRVDHLVFRIAKVKEEISNLQRYLEYLQKELEKEVSGEVEK